MTSRYALGIDLGTTHSALSYFSLEEGKPRGAGQPMLPVPQLTAPGTVEPRQLLPSFLYLPNAAEFPECWPVLRKHFGEVRPAAMMISAGLADPRMRIEIEVTARRGSGS